MGIYFQNDGWLMNPVLNQPVYRMTEALNSLLIWRLNTQQTKSWLNKNMFRALFNVILAGPDYQQYSNPKMRM